MHRRRLATLACALVASACTESGAQRRGAPDPAVSTAASVASAPSAAAPVASAASPSAPDADAAPSAPAIVERLAVARDLPAFAVRAAAPPRVVFVPGVCSSAQVYLSAFPEAARRAGGVVALDGDLACAETPGFHSFSWDLPKLRARIDAALAAAGHTDPDDALTVVGYSQGAAFLEQLVERSPSRYARVVLIASPSDPIARRYAKARAVVTMACSRDVTSRMKLAAKSIGALGVPTTYVEMPGCVHGDVADAEAKLGEAFAWLDAH